MVFNPDGRTVMCAMQDSLKVILGFHLLHALPERVKCWMFMSRLFFLDGIAESGFYSRTYRFKFNSTARLSYIYDLSYVVMRKCILEAS